MERRRWREIRASPAPWLGGRAYTGHDLVAEVSFAGPLALPYEIQFFHAPRARKINRRARYVSTAMMKKMTRMARMAAPICMIGSERAVSGAAGSSASIKAPLAR